MYIAIWKRKVICQCQVMDYLGEAITIFFDMENSTHRKYYRQILRGAGIKKRRNRVHFRIPRKGQRLLDQFFPSAAMTGPVAFKLPYRLQVRLPPLASPFAESMEYHALQAYPRAKGYLNYLFQFNSFAFWDSLPGSPEQEPLYDTISAADVFKVEMARYKWGIAKYDRWLELLAHTPAILEAIGIAWDHIPTGSHYGQLVAHLSSANIRAYFLSLVQECLALRLIDGKIIIWDGRFLESACAKNANKHLHRVADAEAGKYKHIGKYYGVGYIDSSFLCAKYNLTFYYQSFPANRNHNLIFRQTFQEILTQPFPHAQILLADAGAYSKTSLRLVRAAETIPLIFARKNCIYPVIQIAPRKFINLRYVPPVMFPSLPGILNYRTKIERNYSPARVVYEASRMNNRGGENANMNIGKLKCIELLTALTAIKVHRLDLLNTPTAFRALSPHSADWTVKSVCPVNMALFSSGARESRASP